MTDERVAFIVAGVQKGGTTALFDYLADEPGVSLSQVKEVHFFDDDALDWAAPDYGAYHAGFAPFDGRPRGEATPIYLYWPNCLERIAAYNPSAKLIILMRDPVERAWSHWKMDYSRKLDPLPFALAIREGRQRLFDAEPWGFHRNFSYVERGFYGEQMARLFAIFPREQVLALRAEDLRADPAATLAQVRRFLGLAPGPAPTPRESNLGLEMDYGSTLTADDVGYLRSVYARDQQRLADLTGLRFA